MTAGNIGSLDPRLHPVDAQDEANHKRQRGDVESLAFGATPSAGQKKYHLRHHPNKMQICIPYLALPSGSPFKKH